MVRARPARTLMMVPVGRLMRGNVSDRADPACAARDVRERRGDHGRESNLLPATASDIERWRTCETFPSWYWTPSVDFCLLRPQPHASPRRCSVHARIALALIVAAILLMTAAGVSADSPATTL